MNYFKTRFIKYSLLPLFLCCVILNACLFAEECAFCNKEVLEQQAFYEDDLVLALYTHKPVLPPHFLVIPKRHVNRFEMLSDDEISQMGKIIKKVHKAASSVFGTSSYLLLQKNGSEVGQTVPHVHFHYIAREEGDDSALKFFYKMYSAAFWPPISKEQTRDVVEKMKSAMTNSALDSM